MRTLTWLTVAALLSGCVTLPEFRALEREVAELQRGRSRAGGAAPERLAELGADVSELQEEVGRLRGELEEARHLAQQAMAEAEAARSAQGPTAAGAAAVGAAAGAEGGASLTDEVRSYEEAFRLYRTHEYAAAIDRFKAFLQNHPSSDYADNALFWLGECHFKLGEPEQAVLAFNDVVQRYPEGNKAPDALYREGVALIEIGERTGQQDTHRGAARQIFERLLAEYPDSERVPEARRQLEKLGQ